MANVGKPLKFKTPEELQQKISDYIEDCNKEGIPLTITGLALALDTNRQTLINYANKDEYAHIVERAKLIIENAYELRLIESGRSGDIFALKNFGWTDKQEVDSNIRLNNQPVDELVNTIQGIKNENK